MAIYTDFFLASLRELQKACPLRVLPSAQPPWEPSKPFPTGAFAADFPTIEECDAIKKLENYPQKNLLPDRLEEFYVLLGGDGDEFSATLRRPPLMVPGENPFGGIFQLPSEFIRALDELPDDRVATIAEEWLGDKRTKRTVVSLRKMGGDSNHRPTR